MQQIAYSPTRSLRRSSWSHGTAPSADTRHGNPESPLYLQAASTDWWSKRSHVTADKYAVTHALWQTYLYAYRTRSDCECIDGRPAVVSKDEHGNGKRSLDAKLRLCIKCVDERRKSRNRDLSTTIRVLQRSTLEEEGPCGCMWWQSDIWSRKRNPSHTRPANARLYANWNTNPTFILNLRVLQVDHSTLYADTSVAASQQADTSGRSFRSFGIRGLHRPVSRTDASECLNSAFHCSSKGDRVWSFRNCVAFLFGVLYR